MGAPVLHQTRRKLEISGFNLGSTLYFKEDKMRDLLSDFEHNNPLPEPAEEIPPLPQKPQTKLHTLWILGVHHLLCGDSTSREDLKVLMGSEKADLINTDPPYNVAYGETKNPKHNIRQIENDSLDTNAWKALNQAVIENIKAFYKGGDIYLWGVSGPEGTRQRLWLADTGFHWSAAIIWKKQQIVLSPANYQRLYESCFYGQMAAKTTTRSRKATDHKETHS